MVKAHPLTVPVFTESLTGHHVVLISVQEKIYLRLTGGNWVEIWKKSVAIGIFSYGILNSDSPLKSKENDIDIIVALHISL